MHTAKTLGLFLIIAIGLGCGYSKPMTTMPVIMQLNPSSVAAGSAQFQLEVDGSNFASNAIVNFNGMAVTPTSMSSTKLDAMIPASAVMTANKVPVTVTNPGMSGGLYGGSGTVTSAAMTFTIN